MSTLLTLFLEFLKIGLFTFGGGYAMIPLIKETVLTHSWITLEEFNNFIGICECTPGPIAINLATYVGYETYGVLGSIIASIAVVIPSFVIILLIASILNNFINNKFVKYFLTGIKASTVALILGAGITLLLSLLGFDDINSISFNYQAFTCLVLSIILLIVYKLIFKKKISTILFIILSALIGLIVGIIFKNLNLL